MNLPDLMADLRSTRRFPNDEECAFIAEHGSYKEMAEAMVYSACTSRPLVKRYRREFRPGRVE